MSKPSDHDHPVPAIATKLQAHIGRQLRQLYDQIVSEPVPDRFKELLDKLEERETQSNSQAISPSQAQPNVPSSEVS